MGKADQYATADKAYDCECNIHQRLYSNNGGAGERMHPGDVYYVLVCRVPFGVPFVTVDSLSFYPSGHLARNPYGELLKEGDPGEDACAQVTDRLLRLNAALADSSWPERVTLLNPTSAKKNQEGIPNNVPGVDPPVEFPSVLASNTPPSAGRSIQRSSPSPNPDLDPNPCLTLILTLTLTLTLAQVPGGCCVQTRAPHHRVRPRLHEARHGADSHRPDT